MVLPGNFGASYSFPKLTRVTLVLRERVAIDPVSTGLMAGCIYEHRLISMILLVLVHFICGMSYAWIKHVASKVLCAPILLTPISNRVRISSIINTDGHCGISKVGMMNTSGYVNVLGIGVVLS